jgi:hypothetical protein
VTLNPSTLTILRHAIHSRIGGHHPSGRLRQLSVIHRLAARRAARDDFGNDADRDAGVSAPCPARSVCARPVTAAKPSARWASTVAVTA